MWHIMCENTAADMKQLSACFGELGGALSGMWLAGRWSADDTLAVLHELTNIPDGWLAENVACLLHSAGESSIKPSINLVLGMVFTWKWLSLKFSLKRRSFRSELAGLLSVHGCRSGSAILGHLHADR